MKTSSATASKHIFLFSILLAISTGARAAKPLILPVDGLKFNQLGCDTVGLLAWSVAPVNPCLIAAGLGKLVNSSEPGYLEEALAKNCGGACGDFVPADDTGFYWDRDIKNSRVAVERLKAAISTFGAQANDEGRPFIIVAHSWGGALTGEALAELGPLPFRIAKVVTIGTPLGGKLYKTAVTRMIPGQRFFMEPQPVTSVDLWVNYWAKRDVISSPLALADVNHQLDEPASFDDVQHDLVEASQGTAYGANMEVMNDLDKMLAPASTAVWHEVYFSDSDMELPSIGRTVQTRWMSRQITAEISRGK